MPTKTATKQGIARNGSDEWDEINAAIEHGSRIVVDVGFKIGDMFIRLRDRIGTTEFWKQADQRCVWKRGTVSKFIRIASNPILREVSHAKLPPSWDVNYLLTTVSPTALRRGLADGTIGPHTRRKDIGPIKRAARRAIEDEVLVEVEATGINTLDPFVCGDCLEEIPKYPVKSVALLLTDPPYGQTKTRSRSSQSGDRLRDRHMIGDDEEAPAKFGEMLDALEPKLADDAHAYVFCHAASYPKFLPHFVQHFDFRCLLVWDKDYIGAGSEFYKPNYELIMFGTRGKPARPLMGDGRPDSILRGYPAPPPGDRDHPTPKPVELLKFLIEQSTMPRERVCDPYAGSGSTGVAAVRTGRWYFAVEKDEKFYAYARAAVDDTENMILGAA